MILDRLSNAYLYHALGERFRRGFEYLTANASGNVPDERYQIAGDDVVAIVASYNTKPPAQGRFEAHRRHADIQFIAAGVERMGVHLLEPTDKPNTSYDAEKDVEFYECAGDSVTVDAGSFTIFLPHDIHMPNLMIDTPEYVKKIVIKVRLD